MMAISSFDIDRDVVMSATTLTAVDKKSLPKAYDTLLNSVYPEAKIQNIVKLKTYEKAFKELRGQEFVITKIGG